MKKRKGIYLTKDQSKALVFLIYGRATDWPGNNYVKHINVVYDKLKQFRGSFMIATPRKPRTESLSTKLRDN